MYDVNSADMTQTSLYSSVYALRVDPVVRERILKAEKLRCVRVARRNACARKVKSERIALLDANRLSRHEERTASYWVITLIPKRRRIHSPAPSPDIELPSRMNDADNNRSGSSGGGGVDAPTEVHWRAWTMLVLIMVSAEDVARSNIVGDCRLHISGDGGACCSGCGVGGSGGVEAPNAIHCCARNINIMPVIVFLYVRCRCGSVESC